MYAHKMNNREKIANNNDKFEHKRSLGQNFLTSDVVPNWMCDAGKIQPMDIVLEIGPGTGMLTKILLARGAKVIAIEADHRAIESLDSTFTKEIEAKQLQIHHGDIRDLMPSALNLKDQSFKVVANIPYYLSGFLLRSLLESEIQPSSITFLIQKEVAERIARDKKESLLSLSVKVFGNPSYIKTVSKGHFNPMPKIDSAIISIYNINRDNFKHLEMNTFFEIIHLGLGNKRKQLLSNLSRSHKREELENIFTKLEIPLKVRGEDVKLDTWLKLTEALHEVQD